VKEYQNKKLGSKLLKKIIEELTIKGVNYITLIVQKNNTFAIKLYKNFGFKIDNFLPNYYTFESSSEKDAYEMKKTLKNQGFWIFDVFKYISDSICPQR
jgi:ribosomal protein S18 acetylase RimI-like enzyme